MDSISSGSDVDDLINRAFQSDWITGEDIIQIAILAKWRDKICIIFVDGGGIINFEDMRRSQRFQ